MNIYAEDWAVARFENYARSVASDFVRLTNFLHGIESETSYLDLNDLINKVLWVHKDVFRALAFVGELPFHKLRSHDFEQLVLYEHRDWNKHAFANGSDFLAVSTEGVGAIGLQDLLRDQMEFILENVISRLYKSEIASSISVDDHGKANERNPAIITALYFEKMKRSLAAYGVNHALRAAILSEFCPPILFEVEDIDGREMPGLDRRSLAALAIVMESDLEGKLSLSRMYKPLSQSCEVTPQAVVSAMLASVPEIIAYLDDEYSRGVNTNIPTPFRAALLDKAKNSEARSLPEGVRTSSPILRELALKLKFRHDPDFFSNN